MNRRRFLISMSLMLAMTIISWGSNPAHAGPGFGTYYANSPAGFRTYEGLTFYTGQPLQKFVDPLPGICTPGVSDPNFCIPLAVPDTATYTGSDYYVIGLRDYTQKMHTDLPKATKLRGYYQFNTTDPNAFVNHYLGPLILAQKDRPVRILFKNELGLGTAGNLFIPVDTTAMGAGSCPTGGIYTQNRATLHLHGGNTPWISDGTPHQWITPLNENTANTQCLKGASFVNVPDMVAVAAGGSCSATPPSECITPSLPAGPSDGLQTFYYPNQQSARLMFYHDHAYGITRLNVYAGEAAGYLLYDQYEKDMIEGK